MTENNSKCFANKINYIDSGSSKVIAKKTFTKKLKNYLKILGVF